ncbi:hypothetical protein SCYAM73S_08171 [Streptomyces cyaneofuscatus]
MPIGGPTIPLRLGRASDSACAALPIWVWTTGVGGPAAGGRGGGASGRGYRAGRCRPPLARHADTPALAPRLRLLRAGPARRGGRARGVGEEHVRRAAGGDAGWCAGVHLDDLATHEELFGWVGRLRDQVLLPLARGESARYAPYDWTERRFGPARSLEPAPVVLVEGVGAGRREVRPWLAALCGWSWSGAGVWGRGRARDGAGLAEFWDGWIAAGGRHFAADPSRPFAHVLVRQCEEGYEGRRGPGQAPPRPGSSSPDGSSGTAAYSEQSAGNVRSAPTRLDRGPVLVLRSDCAAVGAPADAKPPVVPP